jgi:protein SCO1/2
MKSRTRFLTTVALALAAIGVVLTAEVLLIPATPPNVASSGTAAIGGPFTLTASDGRSISDDTFRGKWLLMFFGYTFCPDACPTALSSISVALEKLGPDANRLQPLFVTVDPRRDTPLVLAEYLKSFDPRIIGLTGTQTQIDSVVKEYRIYVAQQRSETDGGDYLVSHSAYIYLMDPKGQFVNVIQGSEPGEEIAAWVRQQLARPKG